MIRRLNHAVLYVRDVDASVAFYERALGFTVLTKLPGAAFLRAYGAVRPLAAAERALLPAMLRAGALRFWTSRLWDFHLPRDASMLRAHDPDHFERVLRQRVALPVAALPMAPAMEAA